MSHRTKGYILAHYTAHGIYQHWWWLDSRWDYLTASSTLPKRAIALSHALKHYNEIDKNTVPGASHSNGKSGVKARFTLWGPHFQTDIGKYSNILSFQKKVVLPLKIYGLERTWGLLWGYRLRGKGYMSWHSRKLFCSAATRRISCAHDGLMATRFSKMQDGKLSRATWCSISWDCYNNLVLSVFYYSDISDECRRCNWRGADARTNDFIIPKVWGIHFVICAKVELSETKVEHGAYL